MSIGNYAFGPGNTTAAKPHYTVDVSDQIFTLQWSPYDWSQDILCLALTNKVCIATCRFHSDSEEVDFEILREFHHDTRIHAVAISPTTSLAVVPKVVSFCCGGSDFQLRVFSSNLSNTHDCKVLSGHQDYINDISYEPEGHWFASVSDDHTCRLWSVGNNNCDATFYLTSAGMSVCWHSEDSGKLLVAEKIGIIRLYNVITQSAILSLECSDGLSAAHWSPVDSQRVTAFTGEKLLLWDLTTPSRLVENTQLHSEKGGLVKFNSNGELIATLNSLEATLKITHSHTKVLILMAPLKLPSGLSWHQRLPIVTVGDDRKLYFWKLPSK